MTRRIIREGLPANISHIHRVAFDNRAKGLSITDFVLQLQSKFQLLGYKNVIFWGHSRGCLVATDYTENLAAIDGVNVQAIFAVCGPYGGSGKALPPLTLFSGSVDQMQANSPYLIDICSKVKVSKVPYFCYAAAKDDIVAVNASCIPEHRQSLIVLDRHGHLSILSSHRLVKDFAYKIKNLFLNVNDSLLVDSDDESSESSSSPSMSSSS